MNTCIGFKALLQVYVIKHWEMNVSEWQPSHLTIKYALPFLQDTYTERRFCSSISNEDTRSLLPIAPYTSAPSHCSLLLLILLFLCTAHTALAYSCRGFGCFIAPRASLAPVAPIAPVPPVAPVAPAAPAHVAPTVPPTVIVVPVSPDAPGVPVAPVASVFPAAPDASALPPLLLPPHPRRK